MAPTCAVCGSSLVFEREKPHKILCPLHVAAPELLAACKKAMELLDAHGNEHEWQPRETLRDAIEKAEGR